MRYVLCALAVCISVMVALDLPAWFMISVYWVMVAVYWHKSNRR